MSSFERSTADAHALRMGGRGRHAPAVVFVPEQPRCALRDRQPERGSGMVASVTDAPLEPLAPTELPCTACRRNEAGSLVGPMREEPRPDIPARRSLHL